MKLQPLSKSRLSIARKCPWKVHAIKNLGFEEESGPQAVLGQNVHACLESHLRGDDCDDMMLADASDEMQWLVSEGLKYIASVTRPNRDDELVEHRVYASATCKLVGVSASGKPIIDYERYADVSGIMDWVIPYGADEIHIIDWKTGRWERDDPDERHIYAGFLSKALFPDAKQVILDRVFLRTGNVLQSVYKWQKKTEVEITRPDGSVKILHDRKGPVNAWMQAVLREVKSMKPLPNPGAHCVNWYGRPCEFASVCPANKELPDILKDDMPGSRDTGREAFRKAVMGEPLSSVEVAHAYIFLGQARGMLAAGEKAIKEWAQENGPFEVGGHRYGWYPRSTYHVDKPFVLRVLFDAGLTFDEIAQVTSISKTSIQKLSKKEHPTIREVLDDLAVTPDEGPPTFGQIPEEKSNG